MKAIAQCINNLEFITQLEVKEILNLKSEIILPSRILFEVKTDKDLAKFIYRTRSSIKSYLLLKSIKFKTKEDIITKAKTIKFSYLKDTFAVKCQRRGNHSFSSSEIEKDIGDLINLKVDLENPTTIVLVDIIDDNCFIGIDFIGKELNKRNYRIKLVSNSINSCLAYCLLRIADYKTKDILLDPFCKSGEIPIEAALYALEIPNNKKENLAFDRLIKTNFKDKEIKKDLNINAVDSLQNNLKTAEINSRIAEVNKYIKFRRIEIEFLELKFEKNSITKVVTFPIYPTNTIPLKKIDIIYKELFYQLEYLLKKNGVIVILTPKPELIEKYSKQHNFKISEEIKLKYMNQDFNILKIVKH